MLNFFKIHLETRMGKQWVWVEVRDYHTICSLCCFSTLQMFEILHNKKEKKKFPFRSRGWHCSLGARNTVPGSFLGQGQGDSWNNEAWGQVHRVGGLCGHENGYAYHLQRRLQELILRLLAQAVNKDSWGGGFTPSKDTNLLQRSQATAELKSHVPSLDQ